MESNATIDQIVEMSRRLSPIEKLKLIELLFPELERAVVSREAASQPRRSLRGLLNGCSVSDEDIQEVRREMWAGFPREDC